MFDTIGWMIKAVSRADGWMNRDWDGRKIR